MSDYAKFLRWDRSCSDRPGYGMTPGDTMHGGLRDYNETHPCPNGLPVQTGGPQTSPAWRQRVERARRFVEQHECQIAWLQLGEASTVAFTADDVSGLVDLVKGVFDE